MAYTKEDIIRIVKEEDIEFIRMQFTDIFGQLKNVAITASQIEKAVNNQIMLDGSSIEGFVRINESDQYLYPDLDSFVVFPWRPQHGKVARLICDIYNPDGTPFVGDPRGVLKRVLKKAADMGYDPPPRPTTRPATSTWAPWTTARVPAARSAWRWSRWDLRSRPATTRWLRASTRSTSSMPRL